MIGKIVQFIDLANRALAICNSEANWRVKYDLIFSDDIIGAIRKIEINFTYYDPDTTYEADVCAFVCAVQEKADRLRPALQALLEAPDA